MADVTISQLTRQVANNDALIPMSQSGVTFATPLSSVFSNVSGSSFNNKVTISDSSINSNLILEANYRGSNPGVSTSASGKHLYLATNNLSGELRLETNGVLRQVIDASGNIGMGVASPTSNMKLDIYGSTRIAGGLRLDYSGVNPDPYVANIWSQGTLAANSSLSINMNSIAVNYPCAGIWLAFIQTDSPVLNRSGILYKATAMYMGSYMRTLGTNIFNNFTNMYTRDSTSLTIIPPNSNDGQNFSFTNSFTDSTCTFQIRTVPIMSNFRANT